MEEYKIELEIIWKGAAAPLLQSSNVTGRPTVVIPKESYMSGKCYVTIVENS